MIGKKKEEEPPKVPALSDSELIEFEAYFRSHDNEAGPHRPELSINALIGLLLVELIRRGK